MKNWKRIANYSLVDNTTLQFRINRVGHFFLLWVFTPLIMSLMLFLSSAWIWGGGLTKETLGLSIFWVVGLIFMAFFSYGYYVPKGYRRYFYVVCATPAVIGFLLAVACVVNVLIYGLPTSSL